MLSMARNDVLNYGVLRLNLPMHPSLTIYNKAVSDFINTDFEIQKLDSNCSFSEGPVWNPKGFYLFSDIPENKICKIGAEKPKQTYLRPSGCTIDVDYLSAQTGSNGLAYDKHGVLYICQHGNGAVAKFKNDQPEIFISSHNGKPFNSPNDIVVKSDGTVFFSDPPYGLKDQQLNPAKRQAYAAFYCYRDHELIPFYMEFEYPNGLCLSPDEKSLYCCSTKPFEKRVLEFDSDTLQLKRQIAIENSDGIKTDRYGNIYLCTGEGIVIIDINGVRLAGIEFETIPANCCWGGSEGNDLFITARQNIYLIRGLQK
jgi:gluconolactonase